MTKPDGVSRRGFLGAAGGLMVAAGALGTAAIAPSAEARNSPAPAKPDAGIEPFYGPHQAGIVTPQQRYVCFAAFDVETSKRDELIALLQQWTTVSARLTRGLPAYPLDSVAADQAPADSADALDMPPEQLTLTFGFGPSLFSKEGVDRFGINSRRPEALVDMPRFNGDQLVPEKTGGDLCVQACAQDPEVAFHAVRQLVRLAYGRAHLKWVQNGFSRDNSKGTPRNLMGFKDGTINPALTDTALLQKVVWAGPEGAAWMHNGSYLATRRIRIALEHWDQTPLDFQEQVVGRHKLSGAPLGKQHEFDIADLQATDADGNPVVPDNAHMRLASAAQNDGMSILRRSYSYNDGSNYTAERWPPWKQEVEFDAGLLFISFQKDPRTFIKINQQLARLDIMNQFTTHVGSGLFACPPGAEPGSYVGAALFAGPAAA